jgi:hypothetical protein
LRFNAGTGNYFNAQNIITAGTPLYENDKSYIYAAVVNVTGSNTIQLSQNLPSGAVLDTIIPVFKNDFTNSAFVSTMINLIQSYKNFGIRYDVPSQQWVIIAPGDLNLGVFSLAHTGDTTSMNLDSSWIVAFTYNGVMYNLVNRSLTYVFESYAQTRFYFDPDVKVFDSKTGLTVIDQINILKTNTQADSLTPLGQNQTWYIYDNVVSPDGYIDNTQVLITFPDTNNDGIPDDPDLFTKLVAPSVNPTQKYVYFKQDTTNTSNFISLIPVTDGSIISTYATYADIISVLGLYPQNQIFYAYAENNFYQFVDPNLTLLTNYQVQTGRSNLYFQYTHASPNNRRIDPSPTNIMDLYVLTQDYSNSYFNWLADTTGKISKPSAPTSEELSTNYGALSNYKALSDTIIYNTVSFKPLFGAKADTALQATFKVVKNPNIVVSDNDVKSSVINAINTYFNISNWDFGETFYFSELAAYLHQVLVPNIASIIIVPNAGAASFGGLYQVNAEPNEIIVSAATVDNVEIISAITAAQINLSVAGLNT